MPDIAAQILGVSGIGWLVFAAILAGVVRGFSGFGTAMIFLPIAAQVVSPVWAILALVGMDILGPLPLVRRAARDAAPGDLTFLILCSAIGLPIGLWLLGQVSPEGYRYTVSILALTLVACLLAGLRYTGAPKRPLIAATGAAAGVTGGLTGIPGPPVILLYMASRLPVAQVRANNTLFLIGFDLLLLFALFVTGQAETAPLLIGVLLAIPNAAGNIFGQWFFDPDRAMMYRMIAYAIVAISAIAGLPFWRT